VQVLVVCVWDLIFGGGALSRIKTIRDRQINIGKDCHDLGFANFPADQAMIRGKETDKDVQGHRLKFYERPKDIYEVKVTYRYT